MRTYIKKVVTVAAMVLAGYLSSVDAIAGWTTVVDADLTDTATNPGYPSNQSPATVAAYLQDLLNLPAALTSRSPQSTYSSGVLSGLGNPTTSDMFVLALHFGNSNDAWEHDGPFNVFFTCSSGCDSFTLPDSNEFGNYRLYSTGATTSPSAQPAGPAGPFPVPEPAVLALLGIGLIGLGYARRKQ